MDAVNGSLAKNQTDVALRESEDKYRFLYETMAQGVVYQNDDGHITSANPAAIRILGLTLDQLQGRTSIDPSWRAIRGDGSDYPGELHPAMVALRTGKEVRDELMGIYNPSLQAYVWINVNTVPHFLPGASKPFQVFTTFEDITLRRNAELKILDLNANLEQKVQQRTAQLAEINENLQKEIEERKQVEDALRMKTTELERFFTVALDLLCIADTSGNFLKVNKAWEHVLGYPASELEHKKFLDFVHPDDVQSTLDAISDLSQQQPVYNFTNRYKAQDGSYRFIEWRSVSVNDRIYAAAQDITDRKRSKDFEHELLKLSPQLASLSHTEIDYALNASLGRIGMYLNADRSYIFLFDLAKGTMSNTHEWCREDITAEMDNLQGIPLEVFPKWMETLNRHENIVIDSVAELPPSWQAERDILEPQGIQSLVVMPLLNDNTLIGFVGIDSVAEKRSYKTGEVNVLTVWGSMLASLISKQKSETLLDRVRKNYQNFFDTLDDFVFVFDLQGNIVTANQIAHERLGYSQTELIHTSGLMLRPEDRREEASCLLAEVVSAKVHVCNIPLLTKSGALIPVETRYKKGFWNGQPVILSVSKDVTPLMLSEEKFSTAFQSSAAIMSISYFESGEVIDINNAFTEVLGYSRDEVIGKTSYELGIYASKEVRDEIIQKIDSGIPLCKHEVGMRTRNGVQRTGLLSSDSIYIGNDRCLLTVIIDITERKVAEEETRKAKQEAEDANLAKSEFLSRMSHELRTPMNSILGFAQLLEMGQLNPGQGKGVGHILRSGKHLLNLINEVLDISRIEAGHFSFNPASISLRPVLLELVETIQPQAAKMQLMVSLSDDALSGLAVETDLQMLKQVFLNLLDNAIKYNQVGGRVDIRTERFFDVSHKPWIKVAISDTGSGIAEAHLPRLFKPFERIGAEKAGIEGTGLGLSVVKKLVQLMGGQLGVESKPGEGSTFWVAFPESEQHPETDAAPATAVVPEAKIHTQTKTILYIEDTASNIELVQQILSDQRPGVRLLTLQQGSQAVRLAVEHAPDLILLDLNLPDMAGGEVLRLLQADNRTKNIPVVIVSADAMPQQLQKQLQAGANHYLTKPLDIINFLHVIDAYIFA